MCPAGAALAQNGPGASPPTASDAWQSPTLTNTRYDEHYERLADPAARDDHWTEPFKYIPIGDDGSYLVTGIEVRARNENFRANLWGGAAAPDDGYLWLRAVPYADLHVGHIRGFVQPIAAYAASVAPGAGPIDQTRVDLLQAFADLRVGPAATGSSDSTGLTLRAGRQMLSLGSERLVGTRYGPNVPLAFDGFRGLISLDGASVSLLAVRPVQPGLGSFDDRRSRDRTLYGAYATIPAIGLSSGLDLYWLGYTNRQAAYGDLSGHERRQSIGARLFGGAAGWHWNVEGVYQFGRIAASDISAWTLATEVGRSFADMPLTPDATLRVNIISGDERPGDRRSGTFNALFPKGKYFGELSPIGPSNIVSVNPRVGLTLKRRVTVSVAAMVYWRYSTGDGIYDIPGTLVRKGDTTTARFIGSQAEATLAWQTTHELELSTSLSAFAPGEFIRRSGAARTITMLGLEANFRF